MGEVGATASRASGVCRHVALSPLPAFPRILGDALKRGLLKRTQSGPIGSPFPHERAKKRLHRLHYWGYQSVS